MASRAKEGQIFDLKIPLNVSDTEITSHNLELNHRLSKGTKLAVVALLSHTLHRVRQLELVVVNEDGSQSSEQSYFVTESALLMRADLSKQKRGLLKTSFY